MPRPFLDIIGLQNASFLDSVKLYVPRATCSARSRRDNSPISGACRGRQHRCAHEKFTFFFDRTRVEGGRVRVSGLKKMAREVLPSTFLPCEVDQLVTGQDSYLGFSLFVDGD
jgi:hypothetical protein